MKKSSNIGGSVVAVALLLTLMASAPVAVNAWDGQPLLAQTPPTDPNVPTDTPIPVQTSASNDRYLWWLLLIPAALLAWAISRSRSKSVAISSERSDASDRQPSRTTAAVGNLNGHAPQLLPAVDRDRAAVPPSVATTGAVAPLAASERTDRPAPTPSVGAEVATMTDRASRPTAPTSDRLHVERVQLLSERAVVERHQHKVGEIIVRKAVETRFVRVPIRREIAIVEQIDPEFKQLAVIDLGQARDSEPSGDLDPEFVPTVAANFADPNTAIEFLQAISTQSHDLQVNIVLPDAKAHEVYQQWLKDRSIATDAIAVDSTHA